MTTLSHPVNVLAESLTRFEVLVGEFRQLVEAGVAIRDQAKLPNGRVSPLSRVSRYETHTARLPQLGQHATALNSDLRASLFVGARANGEAIGGTQPPQAKDRRRGRRPGSSNALDLRATVTAGAR